MATFESFKNWNDETERDALLDALHMVTDLHERRHYYNFEGTTVAYCVHCTDLNNGYDVLWPCSTMAMLHKAEVVTES